MKQFGFSLLLLGCLLLPDTFSADWPQWRGPKRDGISEEKGLLREWPETGPKELWRISDLGGGYSSPAIAGGKIYILSNEGVEQESVQARDLKDGKLIWEYRLGKVGSPDQKPSYPGARSTATVRNDVVYALSSDGDLAAIDASNGRAIWQKNIRSVLNGNPGNWAYAESPLVDGNLVICTPGGLTATMAALNTHSGEIVWQCATPEGDEAAYSSAIQVNSGGVEQYVQLLQKGLVGVDARSGTLLWRFSKPVSRFNANIPTPVAGNDIVYAGSAGTGGGAVKLNAANGKVLPHELYFESKLPTSIGGAVKVGDYLYGTTAQALLCVEFATGKIVWEERAIGAASLCYADGMLYLHGENGKVALVAASPEKYEQKGIFTPRDQPSHTNDKAWAYPAIADGKLYIRDLNMLWCYDIKSR